MDLREEYLSRARLATPATAPASAVTDFLRFCRVHGVGEAALVHDVSSRWLARQGPSGAAGAGADLAVLEQAAVSGFAAGGARSVSGAAFVAPLRAAFPESMRVARLGGLALEATGAADRALELYTDLLDEKPATPALWKRRVVALSACGNDAEAMQELAAYLEAYPADADAWVEMSERQVACGRPAQAAFCVEEALLISPSNAALHARLAEVRVGWW